jgi:type I restriction enzyme M protein
LFYGTGIPAAILIFNKGKKNKNVTFIDASKVYEAGKKQNKIREEHINAIVNAFKNGKEIEKYCHIATFEELEQNDFNLNIPRYVDSFEAEEEIDVKAVQKEIDVLEKELVDVRKKLSGYLKELGLN